MSEVRLHRALGDVEQLGDLAVAVALGGEGGDAVLGGRRYPWDAIPDFTGRDWRRHFGDAWPQFAKAERQYDPAGILGPGPGIFG